MKSLGRSMALLATLLVFASSVRAHGGSYSNHLGEVEFRNPGPSSSNERGPGADPRGVSTGPGGATAPADNAGPIPPTRFPKSYWTWQAWWFYNGDRWLRSRANTARGRKANGSLPDQEKNRPRKSPAALRVGLSDPFFDVRASTLIALGRIAASDARDLIVSALGDQDRRVRESACLALGVLADRSALPLLASILNDEAEARKTLGRGTGNILPRTRAFAAIAMGLVCRQHPGLDHAATRTALQGMISRQRDVSWAPDLAIGSMVALGLMRSKESVPYLIKYLKNPKHRGEVRAFAATTLAKIGDPSASDALIEMLEDTHCEVVQSSSLALGHLVGKDDKKRHRHLQRKLKSGRDLATKNFSIMSLGLIGGADNRDLLVGLLMGNRFEQTFAAIALGLYFDRNPKDPLKESVAKSIHGAFRKRKDADERAAYAVALGLMSHRPATKDILKTLSGQAPRDLRSHLCIALGLLGSGDAVPVLSSIVREQGEPEARRSAAKALGLIGEPDATLLLIDQLKLETNPLGVMGGTALGLAFNDDTSVMEDLTGLVRQVEERSENTRAFAATAIGLLGDEEREACLESATADTNYLVYSLAMAELRTIL